MRTSEVLIAGSGLYVNAIATIDLNKTCADWVLGPGKPPRAGFDMPVCRVAIGSLGPEICRFDRSDIDSRGHDHLLNGP